MLRVCMCVCLCVCACRSLQQSSGAHILVDQNYPEGQDRMVIIKGQRENVTRASAMINELIAGEPGSASAIISKVGGGGQLSCGDLTMISCTRRSRTDTGGFAQVACWSVLVANTDLLLYR